MSPRFADRLFKKRPTSPIVTPHNGDTPKSPEASPQSPIASSRRASRYDSISVPPAMGRYNEGDAIFTFRMPDLLPTSQLYLQAEPDDFITVLFSRTQDHNNLLAQNGKVFGLMPPHAARLDTTTVNLYLELLEIFVNQPKLLSDFIAMLTADERSDFMHMLAMRGILHLLLRSLIDQDIQDHLDHHQQRHTLFRDETPAIFFIATLIKHDKTIIAFREQMVDCMESEMLKLQQVHLKDELAVSRFLEIMQGRCHDKSIPDGMIMIMQAMKKSLLARNEIEPVFKDKILGSIFLLRYLCPSLTTPTTLSLCKKLMTITNHADNINQIETYALLQEQMVSLLNAMADMPYARRPQPLENLNVMSEIIGKKLMTYCDNLPNQAANEFVNAWRTRYGHTDDAVRQHCDVIAQFIPPPLPASPSTRTSASNSHQSPRTSSSSPRWK